MIGMTLINEIMDYIYSRAKMSLFGWDPADRAQPLCKRLRNG